MSIGNCLVEKDKIDLAKKMLDQAGDKRFCSVDLVVLPEFLNELPHKVVEGDISDGYMALDIGPKTI